MNNYYINFPRADNYLLASSISNAPSENTGSSSDVSPFITCCLLQER